MFKQLPEEIMMNVSSFLLGTPQQMKFKNNKALKQIQNRYRLTVDSINIHRRQTSGIEKRKITLKNDKQLTVRGVWIALKRQLDFMKSQMDNSFFKGFGFSVCVYGQGSCAFDFGHFDVISQWADNTSVNYHEELEFIYNKFIGVFLNHLAIFNVNRVDDVVITIWVAS